MEKRDSPAKVRECNILHSLLFFLFQCYNAVPISFVQSCSAMNNKLSAVFRETLVIHSNKLQKQNAFEIRLITLFCILTE